MTMSTSCPCGMGSSVLPAAVAFSSSQPVVPCGSGAKPFTRSTWPQAASANRWSAAACSCCSVRCCSRKHRELKASCSSKCSFSQLACLQPQAAMAARSASVSRAQSLVMISSDAKRREHLQPSSARVRWATAAAVCCCPASWVRLTSTRPALAVSDASTYSACGESVSGSMASTMAITLPM